AAVQLPTPDSASTQSKCTVTGPLFQPAKLAAGLTAAAMAGGVRSMLMPPTVKEALLPATSLPVPVALWPAPSPARVWSGAQAPTPDSASEQVKLTVTGPAF